MLRINMRKSFGGVVRVRNVNRNVGENSILGLIEPNGAGKTTLLKLINGIYTPGEIYFHFKKSLYFLS